MRYCSAILTMVVWNNGCCMDLWAALLDVIVLLAAALLLGALCERLKQSALLGYLLAGTLLGPNALDWMPSHKAVTTISELGATLLLFSIGLEFSWRRLLSIGSIALVGGTLQVVVTSVVVAGVCAAFGMKWGPALAVGAMAALSSTACVLRLLISRAEIDGVHGRHALGILLLQDIAVVPLVLFVTVLGQGGTIGEISGEIAKTVGAALLLTLSLFILLKYAVPLLITMAEASRNRELPILLAIATALGAAWAAHYAGLSPMLGAFIAGMLLAESPYAVQIRADVSPLRTLFVTMFFSSIGMVADPAWVLENLGLVIAAMAIVIVCKAAVVFGVTRAFRSSLGHSLATAVCLAQIGEFSFVLAGLAYEGGLLEEHFFKLIMSATIGTLFLTPYLVASAPRLMLWAGRFSAGGRLTPAAGGEIDGEKPEEIKDQILVVGFGPAGQRVAEALIDRYRERLTVIELNSKSAAVARGYGLRTYIGDATRSEVLEHLHVGSSAAVVVTLPDPGAARLVIQHMRALSPETPVYARARYHVYRWELMLAGAEVVVDEEEEVGLRIAGHVRRRLRRAEREASV